MILVSSVNYFKKISYLFCVAYFLGACSSVKDFPANKPFVFSNKITLKGNLGKDEKKRLTTDLDNYWDDSLRARKVQQFGFIYKLKNPPVFDSANIGRSISFMNAYLNSQGYYYANFKDSIRIDSVSEKGQKRANIDFLVDIGKRITIDSIGFAMFDTLHKPVDSTLQNLTLSAANKSFIKKGNPYSKFIVYCGTYL